VPNPNTPVISRFAGLALFFFTLFPNQNGQNNLYRREKGQRGACPQGILLDRSLHRIFAWMNFAALRKILSGENTSIQANFIHIMGHKSGDAGERIYTHKTLQEPREAVELITN
jgi:hypothetical protein